MHPSIDGIPPEDGDPSYTGYVSIAPSQIDDWAAKFRANPLALTLAVESQGVGVEEFRLPTRALERINFLPGWTRQNYRTAIAGALAAGFIERTGRATLGRGGARYRLALGNGLNAGQPQRRAA